MSRTALMFGMSASLILAAGAASAAGTCTTEISSLEQAIASAESGTSAGTTTTPDATTGTAVTPDTTVDATGTTGTTTDTTPPIEGDTTDNSTNGSSSVSPGDATSPDTQANAGGSGTSTMPEPTVAEASQAGQMDTSAGAHASALESLAKAKTHEAAGQEEACMTEVNAAKASLGMK